MNHVENPLAGTLGQAILRDVTLRDGLQLTGKLLTAEQKIETVRELLRLGVPAIELGSMARADLVPTMANALLNCSELGNFDLSSMTRIMTGGAASSLMAVMLTVKGAPANSSAPPSKRYR